jgi:hypothetical protein
MASRTRKNKFKEVNRTSATAPAAASATTQPEDDFLFDFGFSLPGHEAAALCSDLEYLRKSPRGVSKVGSRILRGLLARRASEYQAVLTPASDPIDLTDRSQRS